MSMSAMDIDVTSVPTSLGLTYVNVMMATITLQLLGLVLVSQLCSTKELGEVDASLDILLHISGIDQNIVSKTGQIVYPNGQN